MSNSTMRRVEARRAAAEYEVEQEEATARIEAPTSKGMELAGVLSNMLGIRFTTRSDYLAGYSTRANYDATISNSDKAWGELRDYIEELERRAGPAA